MPDAFDPFVIELALDHSIETVWQALTTKAVVDRYYLVPLTADVGGVGSPISYGPPGMALIGGIVLACEVPRLLEHSFRFEGDTESPDSVVTYRLAETATGTLLTIIHRGFANDSRGYADIAGGWPIIAEQLREVLDGGS